MVFINKNEKGINGYYKRTDNLQSIDKDFSGKIDIELFSKYVEIPEEVITIR